VMVPGRVEWSSGRFVETSVNGPGDAAMVVLAAHGAGAGRLHPFMVGLCERLGERGLLVVRFDYPYIAEGRRAPDRLDILVAAHRAVLAALDPQRPVILAGKSMGGRVGSHIADVGAVGLAFLGYPLVPPGGDTPRDTSHLGLLKAPMLFIQGERDRLAPLMHLRPIIGGLADARLVVVPDADHSFRVPKRAGVTEGEMLDLISGLVADWIADQAPGVV